MRLQIYLKNGYGYLDRKVTTTEQARKLIKKILKEGITETVGTTHTYYPPDMIFYFQW
jgi:hypothetical protein